MTAALTLLIGLALGVAISEVRIGRWCRRDLRDGVLITGQHQLLRVGTGTIALALFSIFVSLVMPGDPQMRGAILQTLIWATGGYFAAGSATTFWALREQVRLTVERDSSSAS